MGKQETFQITLGEDQVNSLKKRVADGEFPTIDAAIAAMVEAYELDMPPIGNVDYDAMAEEGLRSGKATPWDPAATLAELKLRPIRAR